MKLHNITVRNFRGIRELEVPLGGFVCLVGKNNAGKSTVLNSIRAVLDDTYSFSETDRHDSNYKVEIILECSYFDQPDVQTSRIAAGDIIQIETKLRTTYEGAKVKFWQWQPDRSPDVAPGADEAGDWAELKTTDLANVRSHFPLVYVPAVRDASDDTKTTATSILGRLLAEALQAEGLTAELEALSKRLNKQVDDPNDSTPIARLPGLAELEAGISAELARRFPGASAELEFSILKPKSLVDGASLKLDDGFRGAVESKGDGFKRALIAALLHVRATSKQGSGAGFVLLYEEPELFLHPSAQSELADDLRELSMKQPVIVTSHSPLIAAASKAPRIVKITRESSASSSTQAKAVDMSDVKHLDVFRFLRHSNADAALFADIVILVEGDTDALVLRKVAQIAVEAEPELRRSMHSVSFVPVGGKTSFREFRKFFQQFGVQCWTVADLDIITNEFGQLDSEMPVQKDVDRLNKMLVLPPDLPDSERDQVREHLVNLLELVNGVGAVQRADLAKRVDAAKQLMNSPDKPKHLLRVAPPDGEIGRLRDDVLKRCFAEQNLVLRHGELENYYPDRIVGPNKTLKALAFVNDDTIALADNSNLKELATDLMSIVKSATRDPASGKE